jgi:fucose 4-O-acetylase-like acetyltransferase
VIYQNRGFFPDPFFKAIYMFHMPLFVAVAGYLSYGGIVRTKSQVKYVLRRSTALLLPIISWTIIEHSCRYFLLDQSVNSNILFGYTGLDRLWFLWILMESIAFTVIASRFRQYQPLVLALIFVSLLFLPDKSHIYLLKYVFPFFVAGFYCAELELAGKVKGNEWQLLGVLAVASVVCFVIWDKHSYIYVSMMSLTGSNLFNVGFRWVAGVVVSLFFVLLLWKSQEFFPTVVRKKLEQAGRGSIYVYIIQTYVFIFLFSLAQKFAAPVTNRLLALITAIGVGTTVMLCSLWLGELLSGSRISARVLFGRKNKISMIE